MIFLFNANLLKIFKNQHNCTQNNTQPPTKNTTLSSIQASPFGARTTWMTRLTKRHGSVVRPVGFKRRRKAQVFRWLVGWLVGWLVYLWKQGPLIWVDLTQNHGNIYRNKEMMYRYRLMRSSENLSQVVVLRTCNMAHSQNRNHWRRGRLMVNVMIEPPHWKHMHQSNFNSSKRVNQHIARQLIWTSSSQTRYYSRRKHT